MVSLTEELLKELQSQLQKNNNQLNKDTEPKKRKKKIYWNPLVQK